MIRLTKSDGRPLYLNIDNIISISGYDQADIITCEDCYRVTESPEEVVRKIMEYRLALINFNHDSVSPQAEKTLYGLAGLEDSDA